MRLTDEALDPVRFDQPADLVGLTALTSTAPRAYQIADEFRARGVPVVMGGMHASALPEEALQHVDAVVVGEAEGLWPQVLEDFQRGRLQRLYRREQHPSLVGLPAPRRDLIDPRRYYARATLQASRGCPFDCAYCTVTCFFGHTYRCRPVDEVVAECAALRARPLVFVDDNIVGKPSYAQQLFARLRDLHTTWVSQASTTMVQTPDLLRRASEAGCRLLFVGLETLSPANLARVGKRINVVGKYRDLIRRLHDLNISCVGSFMFGMDEDDEDVFDRTADFADEVGLDVGQFSILTPLPGTRLYDSLEAEGRIIDRDWSKYDGGHVVFRPLRLSVEALEAGFRRLYERFYSLGATLKRCGRHLNSVAVLINTLYHWRVRRWLAENP